MSTTGNVVPFSAPKPDTDEYQSDVPLWLRGLVLTCLAAGIWYLVIVVFHFSHVAFDTFCTRLGLYLVNNHLV